MDAPLTPARKTRTARRSRSGADAPCPHCNKKLRGQKGLMAHVAAEHGEKA